MKLEKLRVIDDSTVPSQAQIKDALVEIPDDVLLKIVSDYNEANGLAPIVKATEENVEKLKKEGREVPSNAEDNFAFLTPNSYGGTEGFNDLQEKINYDAELVPFIEENFTTYKNDIPVHTAGENHLPTQSQEEVEIKDDDPIFDEEWLKENWKSFLVGHKERANNIEQIYYKVYQAGETALAHKVLEVLKRYNDSPLVFTYNKAKKELFKIFANNTEAKKEISGDRKDDLIKKIIGAYNKKFSKNLNPDTDYNKLPDSWKEKFDPLLKTGREETIEKLVNQIVEGKKIEKNLTSLKKKFQELFGFNYDDKEAIEGFAHDNSVNAQKFYTVIQATFDTYEKGEGKDNPDLSWDDALDFFKTIVNNPESFIRKSVKWNGLKEENKEINYKASEAEHDLEVEIGSNEQLEEYINKIKTNPQWYQYFQEHYEAIKDLYKDGKLTKEEAHTSTAKLIKYCLIKGKFTEGQSNNERFAKLADFFEKYGKNFDEALRAFMLEVKGKGKNVVGNRLTVLENLKKTNKEEFFKFLSKKKKEEILEALKAFEKGKTPDEIMSVQNASQENNTASKNTKKKKDSKVVKDESSLEGIYHCYNSDEVIEVRKEPRNFDKEGLLYRITFQKGGSPVLLDEHETFKLLRNYKAIKFQDSCKVKDSQEEYTDDNGFTFDVSGVKLSNINVDFTNLEETSADAEIYFIAKNLYAFNDNLNFKNFTKLEAEGTAKLHFEFNAKFKYYDINDPQNASSDRFFEIIKEIVPSNIEIIKLDMYNDKVIFKNEDMELYNDYCNNTDLLTMGTEVNEMLKEKVQALLVEPVKEKINEDFVNIIENFLYEQR